MLAAQSVIIWLANSISFSVFSSLIWLLSRPYGAAETANKAFPLVLSILKTEGVRGFYKGLVPALCKSAPSSAITFGVYEFAMQVLDSFTNSLDEQE